LKGVAMSMHVHNSTFNGLANRQRGAVLFVALVFLILLTLLGLAASGNSVLQERMTGGVRNRQLALMGSESAARGGEVMVYTAPLRANLSDGGMVFPSCSGGAPQPCAWDQNRAVTTGDDVGLPHEFRSLRGWGGASDAAGFAYPTPLSGLTGAAETASIAVQPILMFEDLGLDNGGYLTKGRMGGSNEQELGGSTNAQRRMYRVTARSQGGNGDAAIRVTEVVYSAFTTGGSFTGN
jgi:type IV pilus assembly protein PilX